MLYLWNEHIEECEHCWEEICENTKEDHIVECEYCGEECCENSIEEHYEVCEEYEKPEQSESNENKNEKSN